MTAKNESGDDRLLRAVRLNIAEPSIIEDQLLRGGIVLVDRLDYHHLAKDQKDEMRADTEFHQVEALQLSFHNILQIQNLDGFDCLTKLQLDNNIIEKIENLEHLTNLTWLDLSFNNIAVIEGLETLTKLTDLSLFSNCIRSLHNMDSLTNLNMLSVGKNLISSLDEVLYLRRFRNLKMLTLAGNKMAEEADYRAYVVAHLSFNDWKTGGHLSYLDYRLVQPAVVLAAREQFQDSMLELTDKEKVEAEARAKDQERRDAAHELDLAGIKGIDTFLHDMLDANPELEKMKLLPSYEDNRQDILHAYKQIEEPFVKLKIPVIEERRSSLARFESVMNQRREKSAGEAIFLITRFQKALKKTAVLVEADDLPDSMLDNIEILRKDLKLLVRQLFELQLSHKTLEESMVAEFENLCTERKKSILDDNMEFFAQTRNITQEFLEQVNADATAEMDNVERLTQEGKNRGDDDMEINYADLSRDSVDLLLDKEAVRNCIQTSTDVYLAFIDSKESEIAAEEAARTEDVIATWSADSTKRDRARTVEIIRLSQQLDAEISTLEADVNDR